MRRFVGWSAAAVLATGVAACASTSGGSSTGGVELTRLGAAVQVTTNRTRSRVCEFVTGVTLQSPNLDDADAVRSMRNEAGSVGSNMLLLVLASETTIERAEAYLCVE